MTVEIIQGHVAEVWRNGDWRRQYHNNYGVVWGTIWRIPGSDAPSAELLELAKGVG